MDPAGSAIIARFFSVAGSVDVLQAAKIRRTAGIESNNNRFITISIFIQ